MSVCKRVIIWFALAYVTVLFGFAYGQGYIGTLTNPPAWVVPGALIDCDWQNQRFYNCPYETTFSHVRASAETCTNANGVLTYAANNLPCNTSAGLQVWLGRTNLVIQSQDYTQTGSWAQASGNITRTAATQTAPDGNLTGQSVLDNNTTTVNYGVAQNIAVSATTTYTWSSVLKFKDYQFVQINCIGNVSGNHLGWFDLQNKVVAGTPSGLSSQWAPVALANGWTRNSITFATGGTDTSLSCNVIYSNSSSVSTHVGVVGTGTYFWGSQLELSAIPSPYIPTTTTSLARANDQINGVGRMISAYNALSGTVYAKFISSPLSGTGVWSYDLNIGVTDRIDLRTNQGNLGFSVITVGSVSQSSLTAGTSTASIPVGSVVSWGTSYHVLSVNGASATGTPASLPTLANSMQLGSAEGSIILDSNVLRLAVTQRTLALQEAIQLSNQ